MSATDDEMHVFKLVNLQLAACLLGMLAGFVPSVSFTGPFWGLGYSEQAYVASGEPDRARVIQVQPRSPAEQVGFHVGDVIVDPGDFRGVEQAIDEARRGIVHRFKVDRDGQSLMLEGGNTPAQLAAVWYAGLWYPIAGGIFLDLAIVLFATGPLKPAPYWRSIPLTLAGLMLGAGFAAALVGQSVFARLRIYQQFPMGTGDEWQFGQGLLGIVAAVLLALLAAVEIRRRQTPR